MNKTTHFLSFMFGVIVTLSSLFLKKETDTFDFETNDAAYRSSTDTLLSDPAIIKSPTPADDRIDTVGEWFTGPSGRAIHAFSAPQYTILFYYNWDAFRFIDNPMGRLLSRKEIEKELIWQPLSIKNERQQ